MAMVERNDIVISGMSGRFPMSENVEAFWENLIQGKDLISDMENERWDVNAFDMPRQMGLVSLAEKFDADFFGVTGKMAHRMDPKIRILLETTYEAIVDAGLNPKAINGSRTGVIIASSFDEAFATITRTTENEGHAILGAAPFIITNRISYAFNFTGPSCVVDSACSSSLYALQYAILSIKTGLCDSAITGAGNINYLPLYTEAMWNIGTLSPVGRSKVFDSSLDGFVRSEAVVATYVCRKETAKRSYATIAGIRCNCDGYKPEGVSVPSAEIQTQLMKELYEEVGIDVLDVNYIEAHGTGTAAGDRVEIEAISRVFCEGRKVPLLVGALKTNIGHTEPASGFCAIVKVILARMVGTLPPSLHFKTPHPDCIPLVDGRIKLVTAPTPFEEELVGLNSFGIGGSNGHVILRFDKGDSTVERRCNGESIPTLILASGRTDEAVSHFLEKSVKYSENRDFVGLLHEIVATETPRHLFRGFAVSHLATEPEFMIKKKYESVSSMWYLFTGYGSQWVGMSSNMMRFKMFNQSIRLSSSILSKVGFNLMSILETEDLLVLNNVKNVCVSVTAFQIGLTDLLRSIDILPDGIIGHSLGECACSYADGCLNQEQTLLASHARGRGFMEAGLPSNTTMASVGLSWEEARDRCPDGIYPAIHNAKDNTTVGGPVDSIREFVRALASEGRFAKEAQSVPLAFHTPYLHKCEQLMINLLKEVIPEPRRRSAKWLSTSVHVDDWDTDLAQFCSPEYHAHNSVSPVYLYEVLQFVPQQSVFLEISSHCFLNGLLKKTLVNVLVLGLMHCKQDDNSVYFLKSVGQIFLAGVKVNVSCLYSPVKFPVSLETPCISPLIQWDHTANWEVPKFKNEQKGTRFIINLSKDEAFQGHGFYGQAIFPPAGYIWLAWKVFAKQKSTKPELLPVRLENITFKRMVKLHQNVDVELSVFASKNSGHFEIECNSEVVCEGRITQADRNLQEVAEVVHTQRSDEVLAKVDFYKLMQLKGYNYSGPYQGIQEMNTEEKWAVIEWKDSWVCFLDAMLQTLIWNVLPNEVIIPLALKAVTIDPILFTQNLSRNHVITRINRCRYFREVECPGIQCSDVTPSAAFNSEVPTEPTLSVQRFCPYFDPTPTVSSRDDIIHFFVEAVLENTSSFFMDTFVFTEIVHEPKYINLKGSALEKVNSFDHRVVRTYGAEDDASVLPGSCRVYNSIEDLRSQGGLSNLISVASEDDVVACTDLLLDDGFFILTAPAELTFSCVVVIAEKRTSSEILYLLRKMLCAQPLKSERLSIDLPAFSWVEILKKKLESLKEGQKLFIESSYERSGIIGFTKCLLKEPIGHKVRCIHLQNATSNPLLEATVENEIFMKDLVFNIYRDGVWGAYAHVSLHDQERTRVSELVIADIPSIGDLSSLCWLEGPCKLHHREVVHTHFASLNFKDVMYVTGNLSKLAYHEEVQGREFMLGGEFSGRYRGRRVSGMSFSRSLSTVLDHDPKVVIPSPSHWTLEETATITAVYYTVLLSLFDRAQLKEGETILIHSGTGSVGLAAISIALSMNCKVFTTVSSLEKREFLKFMFPKLADECISDSRVAKSFKENVMGGTKGEGVDVVLNSLASEKLHASLDCLGKYGRFAEIGRLDMVNNTAVGLGVLLRDASVHGIMAETSTNEPIMRDKIERAIVELIGEGRIKPLPLTIFDHAELKEAFGYFTKRRHIGKVMIRVRDNSEPVRIPAVPSTYFWPQKTYIIIGGLGGMGLEMVNWMVGRGARKLVIVSRSGITTSYQKYMIKKWCASGADIFMKTTDVSSEVEVSKLLQETMAQGTIGGVFNLAIVLQDALFMNQSGESFENVSSCKESATIHFDTLTRQYVPDMDYFVVFSSMTSGRGFAGQSNYGYANSVMERICERRKTDGFHALAIQWGPVADVGSMARMLDAAPERLRAPSDGLTWEGVMAQDIKSCIKTLDLFLQRDETVVSSLVLPGSKANLAASEDSTLAKKILNVFGFPDISKVDPNATFTELGMDSIISAQIKYLLQKEKNIDIPEEANGDLTFKYIIDLK